MTFCCPTTKPVVPASYEGSGKLIKLQAAGEEFNLYTVGSGDKAVILVYDIFGILAVALRCADRIADAGFHVVIPDVFHGHAVPPEVLSNFGAFDFKSFITEFGTYQVVEPFLKATVAHLKGVGAKSIGTIGFCWGAKIAIVAGNGQLDPDVKAIAGIHPSMLTVEDAENLTVPACILPSKDEEQMEDIQEVLNKKPFASKNIWKRFDDMHHGWAGARGNWEDPVVGERAREAIDITIKFYKSTI